MLPAVNTYRIARHNREIKESYFLLENSAISVEKRPYFPREESFFTRHTKQKRAAMALSQSKT